MFAIRVVKIQNVLKFSGYRWMWKKIKDVVNIYCLTASQFIS